LHHIRILADHVVGHGIEDGVGETRPVLEVVGMPLQVAQVVHQAAIGCVYIYPDDSEQQDARVLSWVRESRPELDVQLWRAVTAWLADDWPFERVAYAERPHGA
jgi:hypothetical protein